MFGMVTLTSGRCFGMWWWWWCKSGNSLELPTEHVSFILWLLFFFLLFSLSLDSIKSQLNHHHRIVIKRIYVCTHFCSSFFSLCLLARFPSPNSFSQSKTPIIIILKSERHKKHNMMMRCQRCPFLLFIVIGLVCCCRRCFLLSLYK